MPAVGVLMWWGHDRNCELQSHLYETEGERLTFFTLFPLVRHMECTIFSVSMKKNEKQFFVCFSEAAIRGTDMQPTVHERKTGRIFQSLHTPRQ